MNTSTSFSASKLITIVIAVAVVVGGGAFYSGMKYAQSKSASDRQQRFGQTIGSGQGGFRGGQGGTGGGLVSGDIISKDSQSITVKTRDGSSKIVFFSNATEVSKFVAGASVDLAVGKTVTIIGKANSDGSITAQSIQIRLASQTNQ